MINVRVAVPVPALLVALNDTVDVPPAPVGVPEIAPFVVFNVKPAGNPVAPKLVGVLLAVIWYEKATPTVPLSLVALVMTGTPKIVSVSVAVPVPRLLVALIDTVDAPPAPVGVPEITPVLVLTVRPAGNPVAPKLVGVLVAVIWYENATPTVPLALVELVITGKPMMVSVRVAVPVPALLVALNETVDVPPAPVDVPEITPVLALTVRPAGNPVAPKLIGVLVALIWYENATPTIPLALVGLVIAGIAVMVSVRLAVPVPTLLVALNDTVDVLPVPVGVPEIIPVLVLTARPAGNPVAPKLVGVLVAVIWYENALPRVPLAMAGLVITGKPRIVRVRVAVPVPALLVALNETVDVPPAPVGVPEITPVLVLTARPAGSPVAPKLVGVFVAAIW
jgi:hypothetical protein